MVLVVQKFELVVNLKYHLQILLDFFGNVYVSGEATDYMTSKYDNLGNFLWSYSWPTGWGYHNYSKLCLNN